MPDPAPPTPWPLPRCPICGYSMEGLPRGNPCPECGHVVAADEIVVWGEFAGAHRDAGEHRSRKIVLVVLGVLALFLLIERLAAVLKFNTVNLVWLPLAVAAGIFGMYRERRKRRQYGGPTYARISSRGAAQIVSGKSPEPWPWADFPIVEIHGVNPEPDPWADSIVEIDRACHGEVRLTIRRRRSFFEWGSDSSIAVRIKLNLTWAQAQDLRRRCEALRDRAIASATAPPTSVADAP